MRILSSARKQGVYGVQSMQGQKALGFRQKYLNLCSNGLTSLEQHEGEKLMPDFSFLGELSV